MNKLRIPGHKNAQTYTQCSKEEETDHLRFYRIRRSAIYAKESYIEP